MFRYSPAAELKALQQELDEADPVDHDKQVRLEELKDEVGTSIATVEREQMTPELLSGLKAKLEEAVIEFEESHPQLTEQLRKAINTMAEAGI